MRNLFLSLIGVAVFIFIVGTVTKNNTLKNTSPTATPSINLKSIKVGQTNVLVIVAATDETRAKGLGGITNLGADQGMLFVFPDKNIVPTFWMKGMKIPLDFIWIKDNKVFQIDENVAAPAANTSDNQLKIYQPKGPVDYVLEVNANFARKNNIKAGDLVTNL